ncbi:hypothetical protein Esti_005562 [Eimeria stiedai]
MKLKNTHALLELDFSELKEVHQQTVDKLVECRTRLRDLKTQFALRQVSPSWKGFDMPDSGLLVPSGGFEEDDSTDK